MKSRLSVHVFAKCSDPPPCQLWISASNDVYRFSVPKIRLLYSRMLNKRCIDSVVTAVSHFSNRELLNRFWRNDECPCLASTIQIFCLSLINKSI